MGRFPWLNQAAGWAKPRRPQNDHQTFKTKNLGGTAIAVGIQLYAGISVAKSLEK